MNNKGNKALAFFKNARAWCFNYRGVIAQFASLFAFCLIVTVWGYLLTKSILSTLFLLMAELGILLCEYQKKKSGKKYYALAWLLLPAALCLMLCAVKQSSLVTIIATALCVEMVLSYENKKATKEWVTGAVFPFAILLYTEFLQKNLRYGFKVMFVDDVPLSNFGYLIAIALIMFTVSFFTAVFNSKKIGYYISAGIFALLGTVNFFVIAFTEQPFTLSDLKIAKTAAGVISSQQLEGSEWIRLIVGLLMLAAIIVLVTLVYTRKEPKKKLPQRMRLVASFCLVAMVLYFVSGWFGSTVLLYNGNIKYSFISNFYFTLDSGIKFPEDAKNYVVVDEDDEGDYRPDVIVIMNEAFSDLGSTFGIELSEDPLEYFHSLQSEYPHGITYSSVFGNNTCSSEWEFLSSVPTGLTVKGAEGFMNNCKPMRSVVSIFNNRGYSTVGLHPYYAFGYNREALWTSLGFDKTYFIEDLPSNMDKVRGFTTDQENYEELIRLYEENLADNGDPFFCFNVTMQNHGGYANNQYKDVYVKGDKEYSEVNTYLSMLNKSDDALQFLLSYFSTVERDIVILIFGDHQPLVDKGFYEDIYGKDYADFALKELKEMYAVPYLVWANYEINEDAAPETTSNNYLANILFEVGGLPKTKWLNMVDKYQESYPVISSIFTMDAEGAIRDTNSLIATKEGNVHDDFVLYRKYSYGVLIGTTE